MIYLDTKIPELRDVVYAIGTNQQGQVSAEHVVAGLVAAILDEPSRQRLFKVIKDSLARESVSFKRIDNTTYDRILFEGPTTLSDPSLHNLLVNPVLLTMLAEDILDDPPESWWDAIEDLGHFRSQHAVPVTVQPPQLADSWPEKNRGAAPLLSIALTKGDEAQSIKNTRAELSGQHIVLINIADVSWKSMPESCSHEARIVVIISDGETVVLQLIDADTFIRLGQYCKWSARLVSANGEPKSEQQLESSSPSIVVRPLKGAMAEDDQISIQYGWTEPGNEWSLEVRVPLA